MKIFSPITEHEIAFEEHDRKTVQEFHNLISTLVNEMDRLGCNVAEGGYSDDPTQFWLEELRDISSFLESFSNYLPNKMY